MRFEITILHAEGDHATRTVGAAEVGSLLAWAERVGVRVSVRPHAPCAANSNGEADTER